MSTYLTAEAAVLDRCREFANADGPLFDDRNSSRDNWSVIDAADYSLVIEMGGDSLEGDNLDGRGSQGTIQERHQVRVTVLHKVGTGESGSAAIVAGLKATTEALKDHLRRHGRLGVYAPVSRAWPARTSAVLERLARNGGAPTHVLQQITLTVYCESDLTDEEGGY